MEKIILDGNTAASIGAYQLSEVALIYPITPSSTMAEQVDEFSSNGKKNVFGETVVVRELQSEAGAAGALHGASVAGSLAVTFTASQGLLLMIPNLYKMAGEGLPIVLHVAARTVATHALNIFGEHSDIYAARQTGALMFASSTVQECYDFAVISHLVAIECSLPVIHFFDGFRTSHETKQIEILSDTEVKSLVDQNKLNEFRNRAISSQNPYCSGTAQNPDIYFQNREAINELYFKAPQIIEAVFDKFYKLTGRKYNFFNVSGNTKAKNLVVSMCSASETVKEVCKIEKELALDVKVYRPFDKQKLINAIPKSIKKIAVLDRTKEPGSFGEPLYTEVCASLQNKNVEIVGGRYGLGGKDFRPSDVLSVINNLRSKHSKNNFTISINDDVTHLNLEPCEYNANQNFFEAMFYGLGSDGTVSANKNSIKIIGEKTNKYIQAFFEYDSKKSGSITVSHLRFKDSLFEAPYVINSANFIACHNDSFVHKIDMVSNLKQNGVFLLNTSETSETIDKFLPAKFKQTLKDKNAKFYIIDAFKIADELKLGSRINTVMQSAFFKIANIIDYQVAKIAMADYAEKTYGKKGKEIVEKNICAINSAESNIVEIDINKLTNVDKTYSEEKDAYYKEFIKPILERNGDKLKVSTFNKFGAVRTGTTALEKRDVAEHLPNYICENCIECNQCAFVCPHACIRPVLTTDAENKKAPKSFKTRKSISLKNLNYRMQISPKDCTGCGSCAAVCPSRNKALLMVKKEQIETDELNNFNFSKKVSEKKLDSNLNVKTSQFKKPLFEYSGACAGCGETPYIKLLTQLCGQNLIIANATGCSSIYGANAPSCPYTTDEQGRGPAWSNSLFEDNAEYGYGMYLSYRTKRNKVRDLLLAFSKTLKGSELAVVNKFLNNFESLDYTRENAQEIVKLAKKHKNNELLEYKDALVKQIIWLVGGDGWAYDIGFGGLDHVLASGENVKVLVLDTEVYSNTGGQSSKATQLGAVAKFAASGKQTNKKRLGDMMLTYKNVFVAEIAMGASLKNTLDAFNEAINYNGPAIIIAYATCINQGFDLSTGMNEMKKAAECGYLMPYIYNPSGEIKFKLFANEPNDKLDDFIFNEVRFKTLLNKNPKQAKQFSEALKQDIKQRYLLLKEKEHFFNKN